MSEKAGLWHISPTRKATPDGQWSIWRNPVTDESGIIHPQLTVANARIAAVVRDALNALLLRGAAFPAEHAPPEPSEKACNAVFLESLSIVFGRNEFPTSGFSLADARRLLRAAYAIDFGARPALAGRGPQELPLYVYHGPHEGFKVLHLPELPPDRPVVLGPRDTLELRWGRAAQEGQKP